MSVSNRRLSISIDDMAERYDVLVIGSGYGGAVFASRLARSTKADGKKVSVALLERGRELQPGEYPDNPIAAMEHFQIEFGDHREGRQDALFQFHADDDVSVFKGCGLGGTSLVNANVALEADPRVFADPVWPLALRDDLEGGLKEGFARARDMLRPSSYPTEYPELPKLDVLARMAESVGGTCTRPPINVSFAPAGPNHVGVEQAPCTGCGDCVSGCNVGAKNTLLMNYLPDAAANGAEIFTSLRVMRLAPAPEGGWCVFFRRIGVGRALFDAPEEFAMADTVVLSGGTLGSTEILLRSSAAIALSPELGKRFTGNGDILGFGYNLEDRVHGVGNGPHPTDPLDPIGPCIAGLIDLRGTDLPLEEGMVIEEGSIPGAMGMMMPEFLRGSQVVGGVFDPAQGESVRLRHSENEAKSILLGPHRGAIDQTQTFLVMSHDGSDGAMVLEADALRIRWPGIGKRSSIAKINERLGTATFARAGIYIKDPIWSKDLGQRIVTVHPLGGCSMGEDAASGVVNHSGQVFKGATGSETHAGLYVSDGSIMPRSLGVNPLLTITALAERNVALLAAERGWNTDLALPVAGPALSDASPAGPTGIRFTETMRGTITANLPGALPGPCEFTLTVTASDIVALTSTPGHPAKIDGTVSAPLLSPDPLVIRDGAFALFVDDPDAVETKVMRYRMMLVAGDGREFDFLGEKFVHDDPGLGMWRDTTTLFVKISEHASSTVLANGVLHILPVDLVRQLTTMTVIGASSPEARLRAMARFGRFFAGTLFDTYGGLAAHFPLLESSRDDAVPRKMRALRAPVPEIYPFKSGDGLTLRLTRYRGGVKGPVLLIHGLGVSSRIFSVDTIDTNLVEALCGDGFDVWLVDFRASVDLALSAQQFSGDEVAQFDHPAAIAEVLRLTGAKDLQVLAHCFGANTFFMTLMLGVVGVRNVVFSQVAGHLVAPLPNKIRAGLHLPDLLAQIGVKSLTAATAGGPGWKDRMFDLVAGINPAIPGTELCNSAVCHRISFMYAPLYEHANLNDLTHQTLAEQFGVANIAAFEHLTLMVRRGKVVAHDGSDTYLPDDPAAEARNLARASMPILLLHGELNQCYLPAGTLADLAALQSVGNPARVGRKIIPGYGHIDCIFGKDAAEDVYPHFLAQLNLNP